MVRHISGKPYVHGKSNKARIYQDKQKRLWVTHEELLQCSYIELEDFDIVYLNGKYYELQAYVPGVKSWWIEEVEEPDGAETGPEA